MMNLRFLEAFLWIVRLQSFRAAADRLNVSQAAISSRIATLEEQLGQRLFDRETRALRLTQAGQALVSYAERLLALQQEMSSALSRQQNVVGVVRIGVVESVVHTMLVSFLQALHTTYPGLALEITSEPTLILHEHLKRGAIDLALHGEAIRDTSIKNALLCQLPMGWIQRRSSDNSPKLGSLADLAGRPIITFPRGSQPHEAVLQAFRLGGQDPVLLHCITSIAAIMRLVHAGMGIASMPLAAIREELVANLVETVAADIALPSLPLYVSYRPDPTSQTIELVVDVARREMKRFCMTVGPNFAQG